MKGLDAHYDGLLNQYQASIDKSESVREFRNQTIDAFVKDFRDETDWMYDLNHKKVSKDQFFFEMLGDSHSALRHQEDLTKALVMLLQGNATQAAWHVQETLANMIAEKI